MKYSQKIIKKIFLFFLNFFILTCNIYAITNTEFNKLSVQFPYDDTVVIKRKSILSHSLSPFNLNAGDGLLHTNLLTKNDFYSQHSNIVKLCKQFSGKFLNAAYNRIVLTKQSYLLDNMDEEKLDNELIRNDKNFRKLLFRKSKFYVPKTKKKNYHWIITQKAPLNFQNIRVSGKSYNYTPNDFENSTLRLFERINDLSNENLRRISVTKLTDPKMPISGSQYKMTKKSHPYFKGSLTVSFFYRLANAEKEYLVITYNIGGMKKPSYISNYLVKKSFELFQGEVKDTIKGIRKYFALY